MSDDLSIVSFSSHVVGKVDEKGLDDSSETFAIPFFVFGGSEKVVDIDATNSSFDN